MDRPAETLADLDARWQASRAEWARSLGRLRLDAEPLEEQIARQRSVLAALAAVTSAIAVAIFALFAVFERPLIGLGAAALLWVPIVGLSWWDLGRQSRRARAYEAALRDHIAEREALGGR